MTQGLFTGVLIVTLIAQALLPAYRLMVVLAGAAITCFAASWLHLATVPQLFAEVPWDVLVILVALGLYAEALASSRLFGLASLRAAEAVRARPIGLLVPFSFGMWAVSGAVNNITALLVMLPLLLSVFALSGVSQRYLTWCLGLLLAACNLGGAASPIGDFPAVLLLGRGTMGFGQPAAMGVPSTSPVASAAARVSLPTMSQGSTMRGSFSAVSPNSARRSPFQRLLAVSAKVEKLR